MARTLGDTTSRCVVAFMLRHCHRYAYAMARRHVCARGWWEWLGGWLVKMYMGWQDGGRARCNQMVHERGSTTLPDHQRLFGLRPAYSQAPRSLCRSPSAQASPRPSWHFLGPLACHLQGDLRAPATHADDWMGGLANSCKYAPTGGVARGRAKEIDEQGRPDGPVSVMMHKRTR